MSTVSPEGNVPQDGLNQLLANAAATRIIESCASIPDDLKADMQAFAAGTVSFMYDSLARERRVEATGMRPPVESRLDSRLLLKTEVCSPIDRMTQLVLSSLSRAHSVKIKVPAEDGTRVDWIVRNFPLRMHLRGAPVESEVMRIEETARGMARYVIHNTGATNRPD